VTCPAVARAVRPSPLFVLVAHSSRKLARPGAIPARWGRSDLLESGVIARYAPHGGNIHGVDMLLSALDVKRFDLLRQVAPRAKNAVLVVEAYPLTVSCASISAARCPVRGAT
jgi:hypothetical protein